MIGIFILLTVVFILMTAFPFMLVLGIPKDEQGTLVVRSDNKRDPRYFAVSFKEIVKKALKIDAEDEYLALSKPEQFIYSEELEEKVVDRLVVCRGDYIVKEPTTFEKEIYSENSVVFAENTQARAVVAKKLWLKGMCHILRWCDGEEEAYIGKKCDLGVSATSDKYLQVMEECTFQRLYAPQVDIMAEGKNKRPEKRVMESEGVLELEISDKYEIAEKNMKVIKEKSVINGNIITKYPLIIEEGVQIFGHVKSRKNIFIKKNVKIDGNVFADGNIILEGDNYLTGDVFSQQDVYIGPDSIIGQSGKIKSVVAKSNICLSEDVTVFGYVGCDGCGRTLTRGNFQQLVSDW